MHTRTDILSIKRQHPLATEAERYGIGLRQSGRNLLGCCPFHADHSHPNFTVYQASDPADDSFFCFACGAAGDVIGFVRRFERVGFTEALERLGASEPRPAPNRRPYRALRELRPLGIAERACLMAAVELYRGHLANSPAAQAYLQSRSIDMATAERCRVGYAACDQLLPYLRWRRLPAGAARRAGLLDRYGHDTMAGRIVVTEFRAGHAVWLIGRNAQQDLPGPKYLGLPGRKPVLGWETTSHERRVIVVEGPFDWLTLRRWHLPAIALGGTHVSARLVDALRRFERVYLALDGDPAGREATHRLEESLGDRAVRVPIPLGLKDVNDVGQHPDGPLLLLAALEGAARLPAGREHPPSEVGAAEQFGIAA